MISCPTLPREKCDPKIQKLTIGKDKVSFVGHELDLQGINMSQERLDSARFSKPLTLKDFQSFLGLVNYFKDLSDSLFARPLYQMVTYATKLINMALKWDDETTASFDKLEDLVQNCQKLCFIDYSLNIILYTDACDYAHGAYLCQEHHQGDRIVEEPIRFLGGTFHGPQTRLPTIEKEAYAIYCALQRFDDLIDGVAFTNLHGSPQSSIYE